MAKANRVIQKPKPPAVKHVAVIDPNTGLISAYGSGTNIVIGDRESKRNWRDITNVPGAATLDSEKVKRHFFKDGEFKKKPRVRLIVDNKRIAIGTGKAKISYEVLEGELEELNLEVKSDGSRRTEKLSKHQNLELSGGTAKRIAVVVKDPMVFVEGKASVIDIVAPEEIIKPRKPPRPNALADVLTEKKDKPISR